MKRDRKEYHKKYNKIWYRKNKKKKDAQSKKWNSNNPEKRKEIAKNNYLKMIDKEPWKLHYKSAKQRCDNARHKGYKYYGERGIKCLMTIEEFKYLWIRDKAWKLKKPSIDRRDNTKHYEIPNCRFIECTDNCLATFHKLKRNNKGQFQKEDSNGS